MKRWMTTHTLIVANIIIFIITFIFYEEIVYGLTGNLLFYAGLGFRPIYLTPQYFPELYTLFTSMFIHGGFAHIFGNMLVLFFVGSAFEERVGAKKILLFFVVTGVCGAITHSLLNLGSVAPLIGASGAIFGIMGAFAYAYPRDEVIMPIGIGIMFLTRIKVIYAVIFFALLETFVVWLDVPDGTAHFAHLGGLVSGVILAVLILGKEGRKQGIRSLHDETVYPIYYSERPRRWDFSNLQKLASTPTLEEMLQKIQHETVPQVQDIWLEHFLEKVTCPECHHPLQHFNGKIWCDQCGFKISY